MENRFTFEDETPVATPIQPIVDTSLDTGDRFQFVEEETPSSWVGDYARNVMSSTSRAGGIALGLMNAPLAMGWGSINAKNVNPEEFNKLPFWKQELYSWRKGAESAWKSVSEKGEFGTLYGEYFKGTTGQTIDESLPEGLKWAAPTIEALANIVSDPMVPAVLAKQIAALRMTPGLKDFQKTMPPGLVKELEAFDKLQSSEKAVIQQRLMKVLNERKEYMKWWQDELAAKEALESTRGGPLLKPGGRAAPDLTAPRSAMAGQPKVGVAALQEVAVPPPKRFTFLSELAEKRPKPSISKFKREKAVADFNKGRAEAGLEPIKLESVEAAAKIRAENKLNAINKFRVEKGLEPIMTKNLKKATGMKSIGGMVFGLEEDEEGNLSYNVKKGLLGAAAGAAGVSLISSGSSKRLINTLAKNPAWAKVAGSIGTEGRSFELAGILPRINKEVFNRFAPLKKASPETYDAAVKFSAYKDQAWLKFSQLKNVFKATRKDEATITHYITAHRDLTRAERGIPNPSGVTLNDAKNAISEIEANYVSLGKDPQILKDTLVGFQKWTHDNILKPSLDSGIISQNSYDEIIRNNEWYATFKIIDDLPADMNKLPSGITGEYFSLSNQDIIKSMKGMKASTQIIDPIQSTVKKFTEAQAVFARNKVASTLIDDPEFSKNFARPIATSIKDLTVMRKAGQNPVLKGHWSKSEFDTINRFKDGVVERWLVPKGISDTMKQLTPWQAPKAVQGLNAVFRKSATTLYTPFTISNMQRDALMAYNTAPVYNAASPAKFAGDWARGFWQGAKHEFFGKSDIAKEYINQGGSFGYVGNLRKPKAAKVGLFQKSVPRVAFDVAKSPLDLIEKASATIELAPRLGVYQRAIKSGYSPGEAALMARKSTIDFNAGGRYTKVVNQFIPFLNARVQGRVTLARALKNNPKQTGVKIFTSVALPGLGAYAWNRTYYSDLYDDIPEYIKQNYFTIITGTDVDKYGRIVPKYFTISKGDVGQMAWNPLEFGLDQKFMDDPEETQKFLINYLNDLSPVEFAREGEFSKDKTIGGLLPPVVKGVAEDFANRSYYTGQEIEPYYMKENKPPELRFKERTPETYKAVSSALAEYGIKISPLRIQNFSSNIFAGYGREGLDPDAMLRGLTGRVMKTRGGAKEDLAWKELEDIKNGYVSARAYAEQFIQAGEKQEGLQLLNEWNTGLNKRIDEFNEKFGKYGFKDMGGIRQQFMFSPQKKRNLIRKQQSTEAPIMKRLKRR